MNTLTKSLFVAGALAIAATGSAFAQDATAAAAPVAASPTTPTASDPAYGLLGSRYIGVDYGYLRFDKPRAPRSGHEFDVDYNQPIQPGLDFNLSGADSSTGYFGTRQRTDQILAGVTAYQPVNNWLKPFASAEAGIAIFRDAELLSTSGVFSEHNSTDQFDYVLAAGAELQVMPALVVTPFLSNQEIHETLHDWNYGVKLTYRVAPRWSISFTPAIDQHETVAYKAGVNFHF